MTTTKKPVYRSVSQMNQYKRCPYQYQLARIDKVWQRPAAWLSQGTAVHTVAEVREKRELKGSPLSREEAEKVFEDAYAEAVAQYTATTPNFDYWFRSGPYRGEADIERRYGIGKEQVEKYYDWREAHPEEKIWVAPDGTPGVELEFQMDLSGVLVRGFIDQILQLGDPQVTEVNGKVVVRDIKTGNKLPDDDFQLGTYAVAMQKLFGVYATEGDYWLGKSGKPTFPYDLTEWTEERLTEEFHWLEEQIQAGNFEPDPEPSKCMFCDVNSSCPFSAA